MSLIAVILILIIVVLFVLSSSKKTTIKSEPIPPKRPKNDLNSGGRNAPDDSVQKNTSYIYLSILENYLSRYNLDMTEKSFFKLTNLIIKDGKEHALNKLKEFLISNNFSDVVTKSTEFVNLYSALVSGQIVMNIKEGIEDKASPKIYKTAVEKYLIDFKLLSLANTDINKAMLTVMDMLYDSGKQQVTRKFEVNIKWLNEYLAERKTDKIKIILEKLANEIDENLKEI